MNSIQKKVLPYKEIWLFFNTDSVDRDIKKYGGSYCYGFPTTESAMIFAEENDARKAGRRLLSNCLTFKFNPKARRGYLWVLFDLCNGEAHGGHDRKDGGGYIWVFDEYQDARKHWMLHEKTKKFAELTRPFKYVPSWL